jgi:hypothetical protein
VPDAGVTHNQWECSTVELSGAAPGVEAPAQRPRSPTSLLSGCRRFESCRGHQAKGPGPILVRGLWRPCLTSTRAWRLAPLTARAAPGPACAPAPAPLQPARRPGRAQSDQPLLPPERLSNRWHSQTRTGLLSIKLVLRVRSDAKLAGSNLRGGSTDERFLCRARASRRCEEIPSRQVATPSLSSLRTRHTSSKEH